MYRGSAHAIRSRRARPPLPTPTPQPASPINPLQLSWDLAALASQQSAGVLPPAGYIPWNRDQDNIVIGPMHSAAGPVAPANDDELRPDPWAEDLLCPVIDFLNEIRAQAETRDHAEVQLQERIQMQSEADQRRYEALQRQVQEDARVRAREEAQRQARKAARRRARREARRRARCPLQSCTSCLPPPPMVQQTPGPVYGGRTGYGGMDAFFDFTFACNTTTSSSLSTNTTTATTHTPPTASEQSRAEPFPPGLNLQDHVALLHVTPGPNGSFVVGAAPVNSTLSRHAVGTLWPTQLVGSLPLPKFVADVRPNPPHLPVVQSCAELKQRVQYLKTSKQNNEVGPPPLSQTMESAGIQQTPRQHRHFTPPLPVMSSGLGTPGHVADHSVLSNLRGAEESVLDQHFPPQPEESVFDQPFPPHLDPVGANDLPSDHTDLYPTLSNEQQHSPPVPDSIELASTSVDLTSVALEPQPGPVTDEEQQEESGYAMLMFPDSYHVLKKQNLVVVRDDNFKRRHDEEKRAAKREAKYRAMQEQHTQRALSDYAQEPSQPSQTGEDGAVYASSGSAEGDALEGRPARGLLSHYSESGGPVAYNPPSDEDPERFQRRRHRRMKPSSSSVTSITPQDLHQFDAITMSARDGEVYTGPAAAEDGNNWAQLPVHTADPNDIKQISREHLIFSWNPETRHWLLHVVGNNAFVDTELHMRGSRDIPLSNGTEIFISTLKIIFRLPISVVDSPLDSEEDVDEAEEMGIDVDSDAEQLPSSSSEIDDAEEIDLEEEDAEEEPERVAHKKPIKLKLKVPKAKAPAKAPKKAPTIGKGKGKGKDKGKQPAAKTSAKSKDVEPKTSDPPEPAKTVAKDKGKKPVSATPVDGEEVDAATTADANASRAPIIQPGSILESLQPDEMPEKRKGPGRPPKNGLLSKRDEKAVQRRSKEYERRGLPVPLFNVILAEVREEQKLKDAAAKGNKLRPDGVTDVAESIEAGDQPQDGVGGQMQPRDSHASASADPAAPQAGSSGLTRRPLRSPSPMAPAESFTEEQLKKPQASYFYLLDEILGAVGQADLQTIYDKFQKRWPYYKYSVGTTGWQSSIRHNLSQFARFQAVGKVGKGQLWAINHNAPREENTKKKKTPPPPRQPQMPTQNGSMPPGMPPPYQHGPQQYAPRHGPMGQGQYYSPYGSGGPTYPTPPPGVRQPGNWVNGKFIPHQAHLMPMNQMPGSVPPPQQPAQPPKPPASPLEAITKEIMEYRIVHLASMKLPPEAVSGESDKFFGAVNYFSAIFHPGTDDPAKHYPGEEALKTEPYLTLKAIFDRFEAAKGKAISAESNGVTNGQNQGEGQGNGMSSQTAGQSQPQPQTQQTPYPQNGHVAQPPSNGISSVSQGVHEGVASQNAAMAQAAAAAQQPVSTGAPASVSQNGVQLPSQTTFANQVPPDSNQQNAGQLTANHPRPTNMADSTHQNAGPSMPQSGWAEARPADDIKTTQASAPPSVPQQQMPAPPAENMQQPSMPPPMPMPAPVPDASKQPSPTVSEQPRPVSAGVKRGAEDAEMQDAGTEIKRHRAE